MANVAQAAAKTASTAKKAATAASKGANYVAVSNSPTATNAAKAKAKATYLQSKADLAVALAIKKACSITDRIKIAGSTKELTFRDKVKNETGIDVYALGNAALAFGGAVGGGTTQILKNVGSKALGKVGKKVIENGVDMVVDLTQTATENGGLTGKDVLLCAATSFGGELLGSVKTNSTVRNQLVDGVTDNKSVKNAVTDSVSDTSKNTTKYIDTPYGRAFQENSEEALKVKKYVEDGGDLYRGGSFGRSNTTDAQFWAPESPLSPGYANKYGVDFKDTDYVIKGKLDPGTDFITRSAPGLGNNSGGAIEIVTNPNSVKLDSFNMIGE